MRNFCSLKASAARWTRQAKPDSSEEEYPRQTLVFQGVEATSAPEVRQQCHGWPARQQPLSSPAHLYNVKSDIGPVQAVVVIVEVQGDRPSQPGQGQLLADAGGQVVAVDGVVGGVENELVLLCKNSECLV